MRFRNITLFFPQIDHATQVLVARFRLPRRQLRYLANRLEQLQKILIADHLVTTTQFRGRDLIVEYASPHRRITQSRMRTIFRTACEQAGLFPNRPPRHQRG